MIAVIAHLLQFVVAQSLGYAGLLQRRHIALDGARGDLEAAGQRGGGATARPGGAQVLGQGVEPVRAVHLPDRDMLVPSTSRGFAVPPYRIGVLFLFNIIWVVFSGFVMFLAYMIFGGIACLTIIGIPFGLAAIRIADYALWPFGREIVRRPTAGVGSALGNVVWVLVAGIWLAVGHAVSGVVLCLTIIGIPLGLAHFKLIPVSLTPLGREIVASR